MRIDVEPLEIVLFGGFAVERGGEPLAPIPSRAGRSLFAYLVLERGRAHPRERLAAMLWPDLDETRARRRLSHTLWQIQDSLGEPDDGTSWLEATPDTLRFNVEAPYWLDVEEFESRIEAVRTGTYGDAETVATLRHAVDLYRGDLLSGFYVDWVLAEQNRLAQLHISALGELVQAAKSSGAYEDALTYARRLTHHDPLREDGHREVMRLCVLLGRTNAAMTQYERCRSVLAEELGAEPAEATTRLYLRIASQRDEAEGPASSESSYWNEEIDDAPPPLVGRERERAAIVERLERALGGRGGAVLVEGDAGLGKSRLVLAAADDAHWRGFVVLSGACDALGAGRPYAPIAEALGRVLTPVRIEQLRHRVDPIWLTDASAVVPELARTTAGDARPPLPGMEGAHRMREALVRVLLGLADVAPALLVIEDVHWADEETLQVLRSVATRASAHRLVLALTYRSQEARDEEAVWSALRSLDQMAKPERVVLEPLDRTEAGELVRVMVNDPIIAERLSARLGDESGGNPYFVLETLRAIRDEGPVGADDRALEELPLPSTVQETILARIDRLDDEERAVVDVAAVHGRAATLETVGLASTLEPPVIADALDRLLRRGLVIEDDDGYSFRHEIARRVIHASLPASRRRTLHRRVGEALEATQPDEVETLAHHFTNADVPSKAMRYRATAAERATALHAYDTAARHRAAAVALLDRAPTSVEASYRLLADHEEVLGILGRRDEQSQVLERLSELAGDDPGRRIEVLRRRVWLLAHTDRFEEAIGEAETAIRLAADDGDSAVLGRLMTALGTALDWAGQPHEAVDALEGAAAAAADPATRAEAQVALGQAFRQVQRYEEAREALTDAVATYESLDDPHGQVRALGALATVLAEVGDPLGAADRFEAAVLSARVIGFRHGEGLNLLNQAVLLYQRGDVAGAQERYAGASAIFREIGNQRLEALGLINAAAAKADVLGDIEGSSRDVAIAREFFEEVRNPRGLAHCEQVLGRIDQRRGNLGAAVVRCTKALELIEAEPDAWLETQFLRDRAEVHLEAGDVDAALADTEQAQSLCEVHGLKELGVGIRALRARVTLELGQAARALELTASAVGDLSDGVERPHLVHWAHHLALVANGHEGAARSAAVDARKALDRLLTGMDENMRDRAMTAVAEHAAIVAASDAAQTRRLTVRLAAAEAPTGRPLRDDEHVAVVWTVHDPADSHAPTAVQRRRRRLLRLLQEADHQGAAPTVDDLSEVLEVSVATVRRDLAALRADGRDVRTRGTKAG